MQLVSGLSDNGREGSGRVAEQRQAIMMKELSRKGAMARLLLEGFSLKLRNFAPRTRENFERIIDDLYTDD